MSEPTTTTTTTPAEPADPAEPGTGTPEGGDGQPDPNSPETLRERLKRRQAVIDQQSEQLRAFRDLGVTPDEVQKLLAARQAPPVDAPPPVDEAALRQRIEADVRAEAGKRILREQLLAAATGKLTKPDDALAFVALDRIPTGPEGALDRADLADAVAALLEERPYLRVQQADPADPPPFAGGANGGARPPQAPKSLAQQIADAEASGDFRTSMALKARLAFESSSSTT